MLRTGLMGFSSTESKVISGCDVLALFYLFVINNKKCSATVFFPIVPKLYLFRGIATKLDTPVS